MILFVPMTVTFDQFSSLQIHSFLHGWSLLLVTEFRPRLQEKEEEAGSLKRQANRLAAKKTPTPEVRPPSEPVEAEPEVEPEAEPAVVTDEADEDLLQQTDDAKVSVCVCVWWSIYCFHHWLYFL